MTHKTDEERIKRIIKRYCKDEGACADHNRKYLAETILKDFIHKDRVREEKIAVYKECLALRHFEMTKENTEKQINQRIDEVLDE